MPCFHTSRQLKPGALASSHAHAPASLNDTHPSRSMRDTFFFFPTLTPTSCLTPTQSACSGSMRNSFFPPRGILMNRLIQAFHHWARTNNLPLLDPSALSTIVDFHFDLHFPQATLGMQIFSAFRQTRGPMGSPASPALCLMVIAVVKQIWANTHPTSGPRSFEDTLLLRYVDNRLVVATPKWFSTPAAHIVCDEHFYGGDILLETETALDFLGFSTGL